MSFIHYYIQRGKQFQELIDLLQDIKKYLEINHNYEANKLHNRIIEFLHNPV